MCEFSSPCLVAWLHQSPPSFSYSHAAFLCGAPNHKPPSPRPPPGSSFLTLDISLTAEQTKQRLGWGRTRNVVVQVKSPFCHPTLPCLGNEWLSQKRSRQVTERSLGLPNLIHSLQVSFALRFPRECESFFCWVFLLSTIYSWAVEPTVLTAACFFFFFFIVILLGQWKALFSFSSGCHSLFLKILFGFALKMASLAGDDSPV